jgi:hypothetical protein
MFHAAWPPRTAIPITTIRRHQLLVNHSSGETTEVLRDRLILSIGVAHPPRHSDVRRSQSPPGRGPAPPAARRRPVIRILRPSPLWWRRRQQVRAQPILSKASWMTRGRPPPRRIRSCRRGSPADAQAAEPVQQREALLDDPPQLAEPQALFGAKPGDNRRDTRRSDQGTVLVVVIAAVGVDLRCPDTGSAGFAADRRCGCSSGMSLGDVVAVAAGQQTASGTPPASVISGVWSPASRGLLDSRPVLAALERPHIARVDHLQLACSPQFSEQEPRAGVATRRRCSSPAVCASRSCRSRIRARWAATPGGCR